MADDGLDETAWRWLRSLYLRLLCPPGVSPDAMTVAEQNLLLDTHHRAMEADMGVVRTLVQRGQGEALGGWREKIHRMEGVDHEMLDESLHYAMTGTPEDAD